MRTSPWLAMALGLALAGTAFAAAGPTGPGQFFHYFDDDGQVVGDAAIRCDGTQESWGKRTRNHADGVFLCPPDPRGGEPR